MAEAVARNGYRAVTVSELVALAGVSKATFYKHFTDKRDCFLATFDAIADISAARVSAAYRAAADFDDKLHAGFTSFAELVIAEPAAAALVLVDSAALGTAAIDARERAAASFERMFRETFRDSPEPIDATTIRGIVAGLRRLTYRRLRTGETERLREDVEPMIEWACSYAAPWPPPSWEPAHAAPAPSPPAEVEPTELAWDEPPNSPRSRIELSHRERIVRAVASLAAETGYEALTIPRISSTAGISNQTFYECFPSKEEAFLAAFQDLAELALADTASAYEAAPGWREGVRAGLAALLAFTAGNAPFARLAFIELPVAGRPAIDLADRQVELFTAFLLPPHLPPEMDTPASPMVATAIGGAVWGLIQHEVVRGRLARLPKLAPALERLALQPFESAL